MWYIRIRQIPSALCDFAALKMYSNQQVLVFNLTIIVALIRDMVI